MGMTGYLVSFKVEMSCSSVEGSMLNSSPETFQVAGHLLMADSAVRS